jgi:hypothetical protein
MAAAVTTAHTEIVSAAGLAVLAQLGTTAAYVTDVLPGTLLLALGLGVSLPAVQAAALDHTTDDDAGPASGVHATVPTSAAASAWRSSSQSPSHGCRPGTR